MVSRVIPVNSFDLVLFGATGDLARRKIWPGLFHRFVAGQFDQDSRVIGVSRSDLTTDEFRDRLRQVITPKNDEEAELFEKFLALVSYVSIDAKGDRGWDALAQSIRENTVRAFYLSVAPSFFGPIARRLRKHFTAYTENTRIKHRHRQKLLHTKAIK